MTAELLGWVSAFNTFAIAIVSFTRNHRQRGRLPRADRLCQTRNARRGERGFTITELSVAVAIVSIFVAVATPQVLLTLGTQRVKTTTFDFYAALIYARSEAIKRNAVVTVTPRTGGFGNGWDVRLGNTILRSELGTGTVSFNTPAGVTLAYRQDGRLTTTTRYQATLTATNSTAAMRCVVIDPSGRPVIKIDANRDGNCSNG
ncbi:MAG: GspH/FimT family pseudopilin [Burkholderiales bacterium]